MYETVSPKQNDCSLSNYAALKKIRDYFNIEVVQSDRDAQRRLVDLLTSEWPDGGIASLDQRGPVRSPDGTDSDQVDAPLPARTSIRRGPTAAGATTCGRSVVVGPPARATAADFTAENRRRAAWIRGSR